ncbi:hypothetical protein LguiB_031587 [Lonicera macranthoides]
MAVSAFGNVKAGTVSLPSTLFVSGVDDEVLALGFKTDVATIQKAADPSPTSDFIAPPNVDGNFFTYTGLRQMFTAEVPQQLKVAKATMAEFPALNGQSISIAIFLFPPGGVNPPHYHPRASELMMVVAGHVQVGFIDTTNKVFNQTLQVGDIFVFPQALIHYMVNVDNKAQATVAAAFSSSNAGSVVLPSALFGSNLDAEVISKAFKTDPVVVQKLKAGLAPKI